VALLCLYACFQLRTPQGYAALREKGAQIKALETQNADLAKENEFKRERINKLMHDRAAIDEEIRRRTKKLKSGETQFIIQDSK
jgi:cell division protein FtsB